MEEIQDVKTWLKQWFPLIEEAVQVNQGSGNASKNLVTDTGGAVTLENKVSAGSGLSMSNTNQISHSDSVTALTTASLKKIKHNATGHITETANVNTADLPNSETYANIGSNLTNQKLINDGINTKLGELESISFIVVTDTKPTASADTMGKLYIISENSKVNVYYTKATSSGGSTTYSWVKMDADILDELVVNWVDVQGKPSSFTPASHTHGNITNDGKVGTASGKPLITGTGGAVTAGAFGTSSGQFAEGNHNHDSRYYTETEIDAMKQGTFTELQALITNASAGDVIELTKDYKCHANEYEAYINKSLTIVGNGHILDGNHIAGIFSVESNNVSFSDICFINADSSNQGYDYGGAIANQYDNLIVDNCVFVNNEAIYGGAIALDENSIVKDCIFINNSGGDGGAIYSGSSSNKISNCTFINNTADHGGDIYAPSSQSLTVYNCTFKNASLTNVVNRDYLTEGAFMTGISLAPKGTDTTAPEYNGVIRLWYGDERTVTITYKLNGTATSGVDITLAGVTKTTDNSGKATFKYVSDGTYTVHYGSSGTQSITVSSSATSFTINDT